MTTIITSGDPDNAVTCDNNGLDQAPSHFVTTDNANSQPTVQGFFQGQKVFIISNGQCVESTVEDIVATFEKTMVKITNVPRSVSADNVFLNEDSAKAAFMEKHFVKVSV
jgi:carbonic anhydrase